MAKVIVERPRYGSRLGSKGKGYDRRRCGIGWDDQPRREGMKVRSGGGKSLNEHLAPLRRYLARQLGKPWDQIFADICRYLDRASAVQDHVRDHVDDYVARCVIVHYGRLCHGDGYSVGRRLRTPFYVCPRTGVLKRTPGMQRRRWRETRPLPIHYLDSGLALVRRDCVWHVIEWREMPLRIHVPGSPEPVSAVYTPFVDALLNIRICRDQAEKIYGRPIYAISARRARKREVRAVVNSYPYTNVVRG